MRRLRYIPPGGALVEVTCRTVNGLHLMRPSPEMNSILLGVLGRAQRKFEVPISACAFLSNHYHLLVEVRDAGQLAEFMTYVNSNLAREIGRLSAWREKIWGRRYQAIVISAEEGAQVERLAYVLGQGVKEGLVSDPQAWPGVQSARALLGKESLEGHWIDRTAEGLARRRVKKREGESFASRERVILSPLPVWRGLDLATLRERVGELVAQIRAAQGSAKGAQEEASNSGGARGGLEIKPLSKRSPAPLCHAASAKVRREFREAYRWFVSSFRRAAEKLKETGGSWGFPEGSHPPSLPFVASG